MGEQVLAANIDVLFIVSGLDHDFNERRIERYLVVARQSGARPVIVLNKADLAESFGLDLDEVVGRLRRWSGGVEVLPVSALAGVGLNELGALLARGETAALIGSSGVGKIDDREWTSRRVPTGSEGSSRGRRSRAAHDDGA